jgi:hypothetical protein
MKLQQVWHGRCSMFAADRVNEKRRLIPEWVSTCAGGFDCSRSTASLKCRHVVLILKITAGCTPLHREQDRQVWARWLAQAFRQLVFSFRVVKVA